MSTVSVPEIWYAAQRVIRTAFSVLVSGASTFAAAVLALAVFAPEILDELAKILPEAWIAWITATLATLVVIASVITRIMAIPGVNAFLTRFGLGSVPKDRVLEGEGVVLPDPRVTRREYRSALESDR